MRSCMGACVRMKGGLMGERIAKASIEDVARLAGVSTATVSRTFSKPDMVSDKTRQRVRDAADQLDFYVSRTAGILKSGRLHRVALLFGGTRIDWFTAQIIEGLNSVFREAGYDLVVYPIGDERAQHAFFEEMPVRGNADAVIVSSFAVTDSQCGRLANVGIPVVGINSYCDEIAASVCIDDADAVRIAVRYLTNLGHDHIAYVYEHFASGLRFSSFARIDAFRQACEDCEVGLNLRVTSDVIGVDAGPMARGEVVSAMLGAEHRPSALLFHQDSLAIPFFFTMQQNGIDIPREMSVMGFDDSTFAQDVGLTTVRQRPVRMAACAARKTIDLIEGREPAQRHETASTQLVIRTSAVCSRPA